MSPPWFPTEPSGNQGRWRDIRGNLEETINDNYEKSKYILRYSCVEVPEGRRCMRDDPGRCISDGDPHRSPSSVFDPGNTSVTYDLPRLNGDRESLSVH